MCDKSYKILWTSSLTLAAAICISTTVNAETFDQAAPNSSDYTTEVSTERTPSTTTTVTVRRYLKHQLKTLKTELKVDANAAQPEQVKDPFQSVNRKVFAFNDTLDTYILRPVAVQYKAKVPGEVRGSYRQFRNNLGEPWNATNQVIQWKPMRALKTLGRFAINTLTTLGLADPAQRLHLDYEDESLGTTLGYYHVPSGPYIMLPVFGPSTLRDGLALIVDRQARPQRYIFDDSDQLFWLDNALGAVDLRSSLLDVEDTLQGDKYAAIRDVYLQRKKFIIAEKQGRADQDVSFVSDDVADSAPPSK
ncbi:VacJ family lipoprotein [Acinetobacter apis]|uniref:Phospholipid-binding lipoprotein MlaA n=1 Tax=Acinetobacter apis TaxID=1229165 RepID=A0A217EI73_9GAMM|nr:VacJ family lipoprotein [Acinetobacter apis]SNQ30168.1 phospholipid-binding lipoprotein MlaA [Acinetobacter apis]